MGRVDPGGYSVAMATIDESVKKYPRRLNKFVWLLVGCWPTAAFVSVAQADFYDGFAAHQQGD